MKISGGTASLCSAVAVLALCVGDAVRAEEATVLDTIDIGAERRNDKAGDLILAKRSSSATKTDTPTLETAQSVSIVTRKQLDDQNAQTVGQALRYTSGVLSDPDATNRYDSLFIRGFGGFGFSTNFVSFLDGLRLPRGQAFAQFQIDPFLLERVEVLKGPSSLLYGQISPGGLVAQISREPSAEPHNEIRVEGGSHGRIQGGLTTRGAFDQQGVWQYSLSAIGRHSGTRYDNVEEERVAVAPALTWRPDADTRVTLRGYYQRDPRGGYFNSLYGTFLASPQYRPFLGRNLNIGDPNFEGYQRTQWTIGYSLEHRFSDWLEVHSSARYGDVSSRFNGIQMAAPLGANGVFARLAASTIERAYGIATDNQAIFTVVTGLLDHRLSTGVDHQWFKNDLVYDIGLASALDVTNPVYGGSVVPLFTAYDNAQTIEQTGAYLQDQISFGNWRATLGLRHDWTTQETLDRLKGGARSSQSASAMTYRAGLLHLFDNGLAPYASYSSSFEPVTGVDVQGRAFIPTKARQFEVGLKYQPPGADALLTASAFDIRQDNVLTPGPIPGFNVQTGQIGSRGLEFEARGTMTSNLELIAALTLLDTKVTKSNDATVIGKRPQAVPGYFSSIWANYKFDVEALRGLMVGGGLRFVGPSYAEDANKVLKDGYEIVDLSLRYELEAVNPLLKGMVATLDIKNLFDRTYYTSCTYGFYCQYGAERQFLGGLRRTW